MADWNAIQAFMAHVVPWPATPQDPGYVNLHYSSMDRKDPTKMYKGGGWPFRSVETFIGRASWINTTDQFKDVWYCLSLQKDVKPNPRNPAKPKAQRLAANALSIKSIWIDADVGTKPGEYATLEEAIKALILFRERHGLPQYSALVSSGNGLHAYWISKSALSVREWAPYAEGLRALLLKDKVVKDPGLTTDPARILRVPGTFNHKDLANPKPVLLLDTPLVMYDFATQLALLPTVAPAVSTVQVNKSPAYSLFADGVDESSFKNPLLAPIEGDTLGTVSNEDVTIDPRPIFTNCGFYREALKTGGADYDNALWMYSVLGATFMENGNAIAHEVSKGHASYTPVDTQALYDRKVAERADRGIGYPSCAAIAGAGCKSCATCPLFAKGKSPLNIRPAVTAAVNLNMALPSVQSQGAQDLHLPYGYDVDDEGFICEVEEVQVSGEAMPPKLHRLFLSKLSDPWAQSNPDCINFTTTVDKGTVHQASIRHEDMSGMALSAVWGKPTVKVKIFPKNKARLEHFIVSWLAKLHEMQAAQQSLPFGWYREGDLFKGFVYGGKLMKDDGSEAACGIGDAKVREIFKPVGDINHWFTACNTITAMKRPELDAIIALSFASPLCALIGKNAVTMCAYGDSGARKSAAYSVGISVWGHSVKGKAVSDSTFNGVIRKMGELSNLPMYWDEIKDKDAQAAVYKFVYTSADGVEKDRAKSDISLQERGTWSTLMMMASNKSFTDYVLTKEVGHVAGLSRVVEYQVKKYETGPGLISETDADMIFDKLKTSHGQMGLRYAKLLAMNHDAIQKEVADTCKQVEVDVKKTGEERLWVALVGTLLVGARLANELGASLDLPALKAFLYRVYMENRAKRDDLQVISGTSSTTFEHLNLFLSKAETNDQMLWTKGMPSEIGKPASVSILHQPKDTRNTQVQMSVSVRWDVSGKKVYISKNELQAYLEANNMPYGTTMQAMKNKLGMKMQPRTSIGAGVFTIARITCCVIDVSDPDHEWAEMLYKYNMSERPAPTRPPPGPVTAAVNGGGGERVERVNTGFEIDKTTGLATADSVGAWVRGASRYA